MKVIMRADDVGYTDVCNLGCWKAIDEGVVTSCDTMLDTPGFEDAARFLKERPWISIGWHCHFWGRPVLSASEVPSLVNEEGRFKFGEHRRVVNDIDYDEALKECRAEIERCKDLIGRLPVTGGMGGNDLLGKAVETVCAENNIAFNFLGGESYGHRTMVPDEKYKDLNIQEYVDFSGKHTKSLNVEDFPYYDPLGSIMEMPIDDSIIWMRSQHPGYLDDYVLADNSCTIPRVKDVEALCSPALKQWIIDNKIELINHKDALYGTSEYQDHLKEINSPLWIGNM